jgi:mono/diheme cytochrome c family protein
MTLILTGLAPTLWAQADACKACHDPVLEQRSCVLCHEKRAFAGISTPQGLYVAAPAFQDRKLRQWRVFDPEGLRLYLRRPEPRRGHHGSMPRFTAAQIDAISRLWSSWTKPTTFRPEPGLIEQGRRLFVGKGCSRCHGPQGPAPRLPLGAPLYTYGYFKRLLEGQPTYYGTPVSRQKMPIFDDLAEVDMKSLFSFVSLTTTDSVEVLDEIPLVANDTNTLIRELRTLWQRNGCLHCHGGSANSLGEIRRIFGGKPEVFRLVPSGDEIRIEALPKVLQRDKSGQNGLLRALEERHREETGQAENELRGMPLTMPALKPKDLRLVKLWVQKGCPQMGKNLCEGN